MIRRLVAVPAAVLILVLTTATVLATTVWLHQGNNIAWNDPEIEVECESAVAPGMVLWHFVAHTTTADFTLYAEFADGTVINGQLPSKTVDAYELHWDVTTSLTTLEWANIQGTGSVNSGGFNLSHVCPNPGEEIPEAPASALLLASAAIVGLGFVAWRRRNSVTTA